jgi:hypothetical protein
MNQRAVIIASSASFGAFSLRASHSAKTVNQSL